VTPHLPVTGAAQSPCRRPPRKTLAGGSIDPRRCRDGRLQVPLAQASASEGRVSLARVQLEGNPTGPTAVRGGSPVPPSEVNGRNFRF
jgi:hypothetical protein